MMFTFTTYAIIHGIEEDMTVLIGSYGRVDQAAQAADEHHRIWPARSVWILNNATGKRHCQWPNPDTIGYSAESDDPTDYISPEACRANNI